MLVVLRDALALCIPVVYMPQFDREQGGLQGVESAVEAQIVVVVLAARAIIAQRTNFFSKLRVVGGDGACIAQCA